VLAEIAAEGRKWRSIDTLIGTQSIGNLAELYIVAREQDRDYRPAYIPQSF
jgi:hypothetical protein